MQQTIKQDKILHEGGTAVPGCGTIHKSEIFRTLKNLEKDLNLFDLENCLLGSTGKKEYSGDIDIILPHKTVDEIKEFYKGLQNQFGKSFTNRNGTMVHLRYPISEFDITKTLHLPRTGFVQIDFNFGDIEWEKFYHYSHGSQTKYKGAHRNMVLAALASCLKDSECFDSTEIDIYNRPVEQVRWKWGPNGLLKVHRKSQKDVRVDRWMRKQIDINIEGPYKTSEDVSRILFNVDGSENDLLSVETLLDAIKRNYNIEYQECTYKKIASNFYAWNQCNNYQYPDEINKYLQNLS